MHSAISHSRDSAPRSTRHRSSRWMMSEETSRKNDKSQNIALCDKSFSGIDTPQTSSPRRQLVVEELDVRRIPRQQVARTISHTFENCVTNPSHDTAPKINKVRATPVEDADGNGSREQQATQHENCVASHSLDPAPRAQLVLHSEIECTKKSEDNEDFTLHA